MFRSAMGSPGRDRGQAAVETALVLPLIMAVALAFVQVGLLVRDHILVVHAAREAARGRGGRSHRRDGHRGGDGRHQAGPGQNAGGSGR